MNILSAALSSLSLQSPVLTGEAQTAKDINFSKTYFLSSASQPNGIWVGGSHTYNSVEDVLCVLFSAAQNN